MNDSTASKSIKKSIIVQGNDSLDELNFKIRMALEASETLVVVDNSQREDIWNLIDNYLSKNKMRITAAKLHRKYSIRKINELLSHLLGSENIHSNGKIKMEKLEKKQGPYFKLGEKISIVIFNFNYGRYLEECFTSVLQQDYQNYEIIFSDNSSTDESWNIAEKFRKAAPHRISIIRNNCNMGPSFNAKSCLILMNGKLHIQLCSDDYLLPNCLALCSKVFSEKPQIGYLIYNRKVRLEDGTLIDEAPFYNQSVEIQGVEQAAVYMMASVNPSISQVCYRNDTFCNVSDEGSLPLFRWWATRIIDFRIALNYNVGYVHQSFVVTNRHKENDSNLIRDNLLDIIGPYILNEYFLDLAKKHTPIQERRIMAQKKLAKLSLRYANWALFYNEVLLSERYLYLSAAIDPSIKKSQEFVDIERHLKMNIREKKQDISVTSLTRTISYDPPPGSKPIFG